MKNSQDYQHLKTELEKIKSNHKEEYLDPCFISITASGMGWRKAKSLGMKKDYYYGWVFYRTSTNSNGYELYEKLQSACEGYELCVSERQL
tara:strand:+ start:162 stop:434 length:273 start_codon:yes stop_codon:yes gene_type:complete